MSKVARLFVASYVVGLAGWGQMFVSAQTAGTARSPQKSNTQTTSAKNPVAAQASVAGLVPGPFDFREAFLLESKTELHSIMQYDPNHSEQLMSNMAPSLATPMQMDLLNDPRAYQGDGWVNAVKQADTYRAMGGTELAEKQYLAIIANLTKIQGANANNVSLALDHLAEFYLDERRFDDAYQTFSDAMDVQRRALIEMKASPQAAVAQGMNPQMAAGMLRNANLHLADLLTRLGELDIAKKDYVSAHQHLGEAVAIVNAPDNIRYTDGLYAIYFQSRVWELQGNWKAAEDLWHTTIQARESINTTSVYWDAQRELAAFYARRGDYKTAAGVVQEITGGTVGKHIQLQTHAELLDNRPRLQQYRQYDASANTAMNEILAVSAWQTQGAEAAAAILKNPVDYAAGEDLDGGSDEQRTQLLAWFEKKMFLHLSILLDGTPTQDRIDAAFTLLSAVQGRYLASISDATRLYESERGNPGSQIPQFAMLDQLAALRAQQAHLFLSTALDGTKLDDKLFSANADKQRVLTAALLSDVATVSAHSIFSLKTLTAAIADDAAMVDMVAWERSPRDVKTAPRREYGAFIVRKGQPVRYVSLGAADAIDSDINELHAAAVGGRPRGFITVDTETRSSTKATPQDFQKHLQSLYGKVIAPVEAGLQGAQKLYIVPDGRLTLTPMGAFVDAKGHYVLESRTITYIGSWRDMMKTVFFGSQKPSAPVIVANPDFALSLYTPAGAGGPQHPKFTPLPGAEAEAGDIAAALKVSQDRVLVGDKARQWLVEGIENPEILHFATHTVPHLEWKASEPRYAMFEYPETLATQYPLLQSFVALAGANLPQGGPEDGLLTGLEVESLHLLGTNVVVLSTCESGQGTLLDGQGVLGLRAAFSTAGAGALVMTLWPVDDQAGRQFMKYFYSHLDKGPSEAVRLSQLDMQKSPDFANPYYWSGYVASGRPTTELEQTRTENSQNGLPAPRPGSLAEATAGRKTSLVRPNCFELQAHSAFAMQQGTAPQEVTHSVIRMKIDGVVQQLPEVQGQVIYDLHDYGNELQLHQWETFAGNPIANSDKVTLSSEREWQVELIVSRQKVSSSVALRFGPDVKHPENNETITLRGGPQLFPSFDIPNALPAVGAYTQTSASREQNWVLDKIGYCAADAAF